MKKLLVVAMAGAVSFIVAQRAKESQDVKTTWSESTDSVN